MYPTMYHLKREPLPLSIDNWLLILGIPANERPSYEKTGSCIHIGQVSASFIGIPHDEDDYYNQLYDYVHSHGLILMNEYTLANTRKDTILQTIQKVVSLCKKRNGSLKDFVSMLDQENLLLSADHPIINRQIRIAMLEMLELILGKDKRGFEDEGFVNILNDVLVWTLNQLNRFLKTADPEKKMPAFLWFGNYTQSHQYLLFFLLEIGSDVVSFTPGGNDALSIEPNLTLGNFVYAFPETRQPERFPAEPRNITSTIAYRASEEIEKLLTDGSLLYKKWQLRDYMPTGVTLKTTYEELFMVAEAKAMIRPYFEMKDQTVNIPALFAKINGVSNNRREYWKQLHRLIFQENAFLVKTFPFSNGANSDFRFHYHKSLDRNGLLDYKKMSGSQFWKYKYMPEWLQTAIASAIRNTCATPRLKAQNSEKEDDVKVYLFTQAMQIPENILKMLQKFDYSQNVPKVVIYNNEMNGTITRPDAALLLLLNQLGVDLIIYNPAGHSDIERFIDKSAFVSHWLDDVVFEQELKEPSVIRRIIFQGLFKSLRRD
jgi:hypothetical protein